MGLFGNETHTFRRPRVQHDTFRQHFRAFSSLKGAARYSSATKSTLSVAWGAGLLLPYVVEVGVAGGVVRERGVFDQGIHVKLVTGHYVALKEGLLEVEGEVHESGD